MSNKTKNIFLTESVIFDSFLLYQFLKKLTTPFKDTEAFKLGIIDAEGKVLRKRSSLKKPEEKSAYTIFDTVIFNIKKLIQKLPAGKSMLASYLAALLLLKEQKEIHLYEDEDLTYELFHDFVDAISTDKKSAQSISKFLKEDTSILEDDEQTLQELAAELSITLSKDVVEDVPANTSGGGGIAGLQGDPPIHLRKKKKKKDFEDFHY